MRSNNMRSLIAVFVVALLLGTSFHFLISSNDNQEYGQCEIFAADYCEDRSIFVLTLDDQKHLESWWNNREIFSQHDISITLFIDRTSQLNDTEWTWIESFHADGHEIGMHGSNHSSVIDFIGEGKDIQAYMEQEIDSEITNFNEHGIFPTSFAYPHGHRSYETDNDNVSWMNDMNNNIIIGIILMFNPVNSGNVT